MICYEVINPSDMATFLAPDRDVALAALAFMGEGSYGGKPLARNGERITDADADLLEVPIFLFGGYDKWWKAQGYAAEPVDHIVKTRKTELVEALRSAAYGSLEDRRTYDTACAAITDPTKLAEFRASYEDRRRSSLNAIVKRAWHYADALEKRTPETAA